MSTVTHAAPVILGGASLSVVDLMATCRLYIVQVKAPKVLLQLLHDRRVALCPRDGLENRHAKDWRVQLHGDARTLVGIT
jgi:hypothetical protein